MLIAFIALPLPLRLIIIAILALAVARFVNWAIVNWAYYRRPLGPWTPAPAGKPARVWSDHLPIWGWYAIRREASVYGKWFWIRPLLIEMFFPMATAWYYHFYVNGGALPQGQVLAGLGQPLHWQFVGHFLLFALMTIATFIDFDEQSIPDYVTVSGTVIGLLGAALAPAWLPLYASAAGPIELHANVPLGWPPELNGTSGLAIALAIMIVWCFAHLERRWIGRHGFAKGVQYFFARMFRNPWLWKTIFLVTACLMAGVAAAWASRGMNPGRWTYLLSSLLGLAFAGGITWGVRLSASWGLQVEALGFGDVTLMAMIGTYVGWQPSLLVFFIAPLVSIVFVLLRWIITGETATPYGPYLCAATCLLLVFWDSLWNGWAANMFMLGPQLIVGIVVSCVVLMGAMLWIWRLIKEALGIAGH